MIRRRFLGLAMLAGVAGLVTVEGMDDSPLPCLMHSWSG
jgi:hypothetical protein